MGFRIFLPILIFFTSFSLTAQEEISVAKRYKLKSNILEEERTYSVFLPTGYEKNETLQYPVIYVLDGEHNSHLVYSLSQILAYGEKMPKVITVGIENNSNTRNRDFLFKPVKDTLGSYPAAADKFLSFIEKELMPEIRTKYKTAPYNLLIGHSYGGIFSTYSMLNSTSFDAFVFIDPSYKYDKGSLTDDISVFLENQDQEEIRFYLSHPQEGDNYGSATLNLLSQIEDYKKDAITIQMIDQITIPEIKTSEEATLNYKITDKTIQYKFERLPDENHMSLLIQSIKNGLLFVFKDFGFFEDFSISFYLENDLIKFVDDLISHYDILSEKYNYDMGLEAALNHQANLMLSLPSERTQKAALYALLRNTKLYPNSGKTHFNLAKAFRRIGENNKAEENFLKAIEVSKRNNNKELLEASKKELSSVKNH